MDIAARILVQIQDSPTDDMRVRGSVDERFLVSDNVVRFIPVGQDYLDPPGIPFSLQVEVGFRV